MLIYPHPLEGEKETLGKRAEIPSVGTSQLLVSYCECVEQCCSIDPSKVVLSCLKLGCN
jgi:hypothetical protein